MSFSDPLGDMLTRIRNSQMRSRSVCLTPASNLRGRVLDVLADEGFIKGYNETEVDGFRRYDRPCCTRSECRGRNPLPRQLG